MHGAVQSNFKWNMLPMPKGPGGKFGAILTVAPIGMNRQSKAQDQTWQALKWFTDRETGVLLGLQSTGSATPGMRKDVYCDERLLSDPTFTREMQERVCRIMDQAAGVPYAFLELQAARGGRRGAQAHGRLPHQHGRSQPQTMRALTAEVQAVLDLPR